jgi:glycosyl hydrolase group 75 (putative chitosanase)
MSFTPPPKSADLVKGVPFDTATDTAADAKNRYDQFDQSGTKDPNCCKVLLQFPSGGPVFWSSKMAIDADGPAAGPGRLNGKQLDPGSGQNNTSLRLAGEGSLPSETMRYIVLPEKKKDSPDSFHPDLSLGDVSVVIYKDKLTTAICGDMGPASKIGEASIATHLGLKGAAPDPCKRDSADGPCTRITDSSIEQDVLFFVFPGSAFGVGELTIENLNVKVNERALSLFNALRGTT